MNKIGCKVKQDNDAEIKIETILFRDNDLLKRNITKV